MSREALKLALEALESVLCDPEGNVCWQGSYADRDIIGDALDVFRTALREALNKEALHKLASESLKEGLCLDDWAKIECVNHDCDRCKALAEQPAQQEPVAWRWLYNGQPDSEKHFSMPGPDAAVISRAAACEFPRTVQYLYTSPPAQRKPLTDEQIEALAKQHFAKDERSFKSCARAIEAAHGIKENT